MQEFSKSDICYFVLILLDTQHKTPVKVASQNIIILVILVKMPSKEVARQNRICIVPVCNAKNSDYPDRIFFAVPENKKNAWLELVGGDTSSIKPKKRLFCCENHFDVRCTLFMLFYAKFSSSFSSV